MNELHCGDSVIIAYVGLPGWGATVTESDTRVPGFQTLTVRDSNGRTWGFYCRGGRWYSVFGRRRVLIGAEAGEGESVKRLTGPGGVSP